MVELRQRRLQLWWQELADLVAVTDFHAEAPRLGEGNEQDSVPHEEREQSLSEFHQFTIDRKSLRFVVDDQTYAISGGVTGPAATQTRLRVWLGDPATGHKLRDPTLGTETLVSGNSIVDLPGGYNVFALVLDSFQLPANIPQPPGSDHPWVLTASAIGGEAECDPVLLPAPEYAPGIADVTEVAPGALQPPIITDPPPGGTIARGDTTYEIRGLQARSSSPLLIEAWSDEENVVTRPFATVLSPGETSFSLLVKLPAEGPNAFLVRVTDLSSGLETAPVLVPDITRRQHQEVEDLRHT
jgi:hypothetical protein